MSQSGSVLRKTELETAWTWEGKQKDALQPTARAANLQILPHLALSFYLKGSSASILSLNRWKTGRVTSVETFSKRKDPGIVIWGATNFFVGIIQ